MLVENTLFGIYDKVKIAIERIRTFEPPEGYYVAFSGGKDSCVVLDLVKRAGVKYDSHYNLTTVDPPELVHFIKQYHPEVEIVRPKETMWQLIARKGNLPSRTIRWCCDVLKEDSGTNRTVITGVRWAESTRRKNSRRMVESCYKHKHKTYLNPIIDWTNEEVWQFIHKNEISYCSLYDEGFERLGCVLCPMQSTKGRKKETDRWPKIANSYRKACHKGFEVMKTRLAARGETPKWDNGDEWFEWWLCDSDAHEKQDPDQTVMFE